MLMPGDRWYKAFNRLTTSRPVVKAAGLIHPAVLYSLGNFFSLRSRNVSEKKTARHAESLLRIAESSFFNKGNDTFVMGHVHLPRIERFGAKVFVILGDWITHFSFLRMEKGEFFLESAQKEGKTFNDTL
jgi:UDP-2,3-diacylglucosamine hydrolase